MKKTKLMRAALLLLVLTLITSCFVGGTFAKYVTDGKSTDNARVAKWGVTVDATPNSAFANLYRNGSSVTVEADEKVVAPGTSGNMTAVKLSGTPEVAVKVSYVATFNVSGWEIPSTGGTNKFYCPLHIKVGKTLIDGEGFTDEAEFEKAVSEAISGYSKNYAAGTDLSAASVTTPSVSWEWPFEAPADNQAKNPQTNENDTKLGNLEKAPTVSLEVTTTVTQVD